MTGKFKNSNDFFVDEDKNCIYFDDIRSSYNLKDGVKYLIYFSTTLDIRKYMNSGSRYEKLGILAEENYRIDKYYEI